MKAALFGLGRRLPRRLAAGIRQLEEPGGLRQTWDLLAVTRRGAGLLADSAVCCRCGTLLIPGDLGEEMLAHAAARRVVSVGLDRRDSLTFSSLTDSGAVLCVQRTLLRPDGGEVEPQEIPLPRLQLPPEEALLLWGLRLLG